MENINFKPIRQPLIYWTVYLLYFHCVNKLDNPELSISTSLLSLPIFASIFYGVWLILEHVYARGKRTLALLYLSLLYLCSFAVCYVLLYGSGGLSIIYGTYIVQEYGFSWPQYIQTLLSMNVQFSILAVLYYEHRKKLKLEREKRYEVESRLYAEKMKTAYEYTALAAQVSPHFLANIFWRWQAMLQNTFENLSKEIYETYQLMRYYMYANDIERPHTVSLKEEIIQAKRFAALFNMGSKYRPCIVWSQPEELEDYDIAPTGLLTLLENAFKHGVYSDRDHPVQVKIETAEQTCKIEVSNKIKRYKRKSSHKMGLKNMVRRMQIAYGEGFTFEKGGDGEVFTATVRYITKAKQSKYEKTDRNHSR